MLLLFILSLISFSHAFQYRYCSSATLDAKSYPPLPVNSVPVTTQVLIRHGERTPNGGSLKNQGDSWDCNSELSGLDNTMNLDVVKSVYNPADHPFSAEFWGGSCEVGQLTTKGMYHCISYAA